nr:biotin--[acetyl-CoA-carboxylase] ligase [Wenzhouxiangella sp. XN24]
MQALAPGHPVSGEALGRALGVSRAAVWKAVRRLVALGVPVEARRGRGYCLPAPLELLDPAAIRAALQPAACDQLGLLEVVAEIDSTNARVLAGGLPLGTLAACLAEYQSAGRGRRGRRWLAPPASGICLSVGGRMAAAPADFAALPAAVGVACATALEALGVAGVRLKWPNDLLLDDAKLGGVLIELRGEAQGPATLAVGLGLNLRLGTAARAAIVSAGGLPPADLAAVAPGLGRNRIAAALIEALTTCIVRAPAALSDAVLADWATRDAMHGRPVCVSAGSSQRRGIARGIDRSGALLLETADGSRQRITAGEVTLRAAG